MDLIEFRHPLSVAAGASVVGKKEFDGPLGAYFDLHADDDRFGTDTWEKAESEMQRLAFNTMLKKAKVRDRDIGALFAGDLINQCTSSAYGLLDFDIPYFGLYGACSTMAEGMMLASLLIDSGHYQRVAAVSSSHYCSAERQYRFPIEYGGQRTPSAQWTVTGCGSVLLQKAKGSVYVRQALPGRVMELGITDVNNMGAAMAPAACDTLMRYFKESGRTPQSFDAIFTGDLGAVGHGIVLEQMRAAGYEMQDNYNDCGLLIYARSNQDVHAGGSGCGCSASIFCGMILRRFLSGLYHNVLFIGTGALMSPVSLLQGEPIPAVAHLLYLSDSKEG